MPLVSVIIPSYNSAKYVRGAIDSVLSQTHQEFEIIVVDDGSTDNTKEILQPLLTDPRIRHHYQDNRGLPGARNAGAQVSKGDFLAFLDADDFLAPSALESMQKAFLSTGAAWLNVGVLKLEGDRKTVRHPRRPSGDLLRAILEDDFITRSPFYPRKEFFDIGMYDEEIRMREDWELNIRMVAAGKPFVLLDEPLYLYTRTAGSITTSNLHKLFFYTEKLLQKHHKRLADQGTEQVSRLYASNMLLLACRYYYEARDPREARRCLRESIRYDANPLRLIRPFLQLLKYSLAQSTNHSQRP